MNLKELKKELKSMDIDELLQWFEEELLIIDFKDYDWGKYKSKELARNIRLYKIDLDDVISEEDINQYLDIFKKSNKDISELNWDTINNLYATEHIDMMIAEFKRRFNSKEYKEYIKTNK